MTTFCRLSGQKATGSLLLMSTLALSFFLLATPLPSLASTENPALPQNFQTNMVQAQQADSTDYYVAVNGGSDSNPGTIERPFKSIAKAIGLATPGDSIFLRGGTYRESIAMDKSGAPGAPITIQAYESEYVSISGAVEVTGWSGPDDEGIFMARVPIAQDLPIESNQVFVDGKMVPQAREPDLLDPVDPFTQQWLPMIKGKAVSLQAANGQWIRAVDRGGAAVLADADVPGPWEEFYLIDTNGGELESGDEVGFLTYDHRHYLTAENGGTAGSASDILIADREEFELWQTFRIQKLSGDGKVASGDVVALQAAKGGFLTADRTDGACGGGEVHANSATVSDCEKFTLTLDLQPLILFDENTLDLDSADNALAGSYVWGPFGHKWSLNMASVTGSAPGKLTLGETDEWWTLDEGSHGYGTIIGGRSALDSDNEWHFAQDRSGTEGTLYFKPPAGLDPNMLNVEMRQKTWAANIAASHIVLRNLDFVAGQIHLIGNANTLDNVKVNYGTHFVFRKTIGEFNGVEHGTNGVYFKGNDNVMKNSEIAYSAGSGMVMEGNGNMVKNCLIHDFGYMGTYTSGVYFKGAGATLTHSTLFNSGRDILHLGGCVDCAITHNLLHDSTLLTNDSGVIYSFGHDLQGTEIAYNWIQGVTDPNRNVSSIHLGIYLDNGSRNALIHHNLIAGLANKSGIGPNTPHEGHLICNNTIVHNRFVASAEQPDFDRIGDHSVCICDFDANAALLPAFHFEEIGECIHQRDAARNVTESWCVNPDPVYWQDASRLKVYNTQYYASFEQASIDLNAPQEIVIAANGWQIVGHPDFRPKDGSSLVDAGTVCDGVTAEITGLRPDLGAYENSGTNWIPGYSAVPRTLNDRYDVAKDRTLYVGPPGVLANDIVANGNPRAYYLVEDESGYHVDELGWYNDAWHVRNVTSDAMPAAPPSPTESTLASVSADGYPRVYYKARGLGGDYVHELAWDDAIKGWTWRDITSAATPTVTDAAVAETSPLVSTTVNGAPRVYFLTPQGHVQELAWVVDAWHHRDLTADASAPLADSGLLAVTTVTNDDPRVYYRTANGHIHELAWRSLTHVWYHRDLTAETGGDPAERRVLSATTANLEPRIYYVGATDGHINELAWFSSQWHWRDLTTAVETENGITLLPVAEGSPLSVTTIGSRGNPRVYYLGQGPDGLHIQELAWLGDRWSYLDVTAEVDNAPAVDGNAPVIAGQAMAVMNADDRPHIFYLGTDGHVHQLAWDDQWRDEDITAASGSRALRDVLFYAMSATTAKDGELTAKLVSDTQQGSLTLHEDGSFVYEPEAGFTGRDSFTYVASTGAVDSAEATVELDVTDECAPVDGNLVQNYCFVDGTLPWRTYHDAYLARDSVSSSSPFAGDQSAMITVWRWGRNIQFYQTGISLMPETTYELSFAALSNNGQDMSLYLHNHRSPYTSYGLRGVRVNLEPYWKVFTITFTTPARSDMNNARLRFWLAPYAKSGTVYQIDRVMLRPVDDLQAGAAAAASQQLVEGTVFDDEDGL
ncbi:MAG: carbohydrate binding domain-containing protein, partial [Caldilineaceae bacterium]|nr:carbohydrate binding domain-containing protein [Caldilineaceae bacterium]